MVYDFKPLEKKIADVEERLARDLTGVRTGRANPAILDGVFIETYGTRMPINQVATITVEDARSLRISPWDSSNTKEIEKAITQANLGISVGADEKGVRVFFPELTAERRASLLKLAKEKVESAKVSLRAARDEVWGDIQSKERKGEMPEDDKFRAKEDMQRRVDEANAAFDAALERKAKELAA